MTQKTPRFLVADDIAVNRQLLSYFLRGYGQVDFAQDGQEVLEKFLAAYKEGTSYDAIFLDIMMPVADGQEALRNIRSFEATQGLGVNKEVKVVMVTSLGDYDNLKESLKQGAVEYLVKPVKEAGFKQLLGRLGFNRVG